MSMREYSGNKPLMSFLRAARFAPVLQTDTTWVLSKTLQPLFADKSVQQGL